jgi:hypothetical protein
VAGPDDEARENIDRLLPDAGWHVVDPGDVNLSVLRGTEIGTFAFKT